MTTVQQPPDIASFIALSDERDLHLRLRLAAWAEGYAHGARNQFAAGYAAAIADLKRTDRELYDAFRLTAWRRAPGGTAWLDSVRRNGGTDFGGLGKPRVPVDPAVIQAARKGGTG